MHLLSCRVIEINTRILPTASADYFRAEPDRIILASRSVASIADAIENDD